MQYIPSNAFAPYIGAPGLALDINGGRAVISGATVAIASTAISLSPNTITYIYLDLNAGVISSNNSGFPANSYSIAIVTTNKDTIALVTDYRPDVPGGNTTVGAPYVQITSTSDLIGFGSSGSLQTTLKVTTGANTLIETLPTAVGISGYTVTLMKVDATAGTVAFATTSSQTINGSSVMPVITNQWQSITVQSDNANWVITATAN